MRSPKPEPQNSPENYDLNYVGDKSETRSRRSNQPHIHDDPDYGDPAVGHEEIPAARDADIVQTKVADDNHDNTNDKVMVGPEVPREKKEKKMTLNRLSAMYEITYKGDVQYKTFQEDGSSAKNVMPIALHHPRVCQHQPTSPALTMRVQVEDIEKEKKKKIPFATEGEEGITKCDST